ncbi:hypothetical protein DVH05_005330 [Phytophthora capsici]|nr:hypothetical protein DVH05_005330 [Phytophthora capsici]
MTTAPASPNRQGRTFVASVVIASKRSKRGLNTVERQPFGRTQHHRRTAPYNSSSAPPAHTALNLHQSPAIPLCSPILGQYLARIHDFNRTRRTPSQSEAPSNHNRPT